MLATKIYCLNYQVDRLNKSREPQTGQNKNTPNVVVPIYCSIKFNKIITLDKTLSLLNMNRMVGVLCCLAYKSLNFEENLDKYLVLATDIGLLLAGLGVVAFCREAFSCSTSASSCLFLLYIET